jgi:uridine monophosphate synthetase
MLVVVNREQGGKENLEELGFRVHALAKISEIVNSLYQKKHISKVQTDEVLDYVKNFKVAKNTT